MDNQSCFIKNISNGDEIIHHKTGKANDLYHHIILFTIACLWSKWNTRLSSSAPTYRQGPEKRFNVLFTPAQWSSDWQNHPLVTLYSNMDNTMTYPSDWRSKLVSVPECQEPFQVSHVFLLFVWPADENHSDIHYGTLSFMWRRQTKRSGKLKRGSSDKSV